MERLNKVAVVTGANTGIGYHTAYELVKHGYTVVLACRNEDKALRAKDAIMQDFQEAHVEYMHLDLSDLTSIRAFANEFKKQFNSLDILVENAGIMMPPRQVTVDGFESQLGVNFLGHFVLTKHLFELISRTPNARVISLSSVAHKSGRINFEDLHSIRKYNRFGAYAQSKLACFLFGYELHRRLSKSKINVKSIIAHPGGSDTELGRHLSPFWYQLFLPFIRMFTHSPKKAAQPSLMAALNSNINSGDFVGPTGFLELKGDPGIVIANRHAYCEETAKKLWEKAEEYTNEIFTI